MSEIDDKIKECRRRRNEYMRLIKDLDLMRIAYARSIATETMNIEELKKMKESDVSYESKRKL